MEWNRTHESIAMIDTVIRHLARYATHREPGVPPTVMQRLVIGLFIVASRAILWFVYGIFVAIPVFLFEIELFGADVRESGFAAIACLFAIGTLLGLRNATDYWRHYER